MIIDVIRKEISHHLSKIDQFVSFTMKFTKMRKNRTVPKSEQISFLIRIINRKEEKNSNFMELKYEGENIDEIFIVAHFACALLAFGSLSPHFIPNRLASSPPLPPNRHFG